MARVAKHRPAASDIDRQYLDYLMGEWGDVPNVERQWAELEEHERLDFVLEWPIKEDRLGQLEQLAADGLLNDEQLGRYRELQAVVEKHRPIVERLLSEDDPTIPR